MSVFELSSALCSWLLRGLFSSFVMCRCVQVFAANRCEHGRLHLRKGRRRVACYGNLTSLGLIVSVMRLV